MNSNCLNDHMVTFHVVRLKKFSSVALALALQKCEMTQCE